MKLWTVFFVEKLSQVLIVEFNILEVLLVTSNFFTDDEFLEINQTVLNLKFLFLSTYKFIL